MSAGILNLVQSWNLYNMLWGLIVTQMLCSLKALRFDLETLHLFCFGVQVSK